MSVSKILRTRYLCFCSHLDICKFPSDVRWYIWLKLYELERDRPPDVIEPSKYTWMMKTDNKDEVIHRDFDFPAVIILKDGKIWKKEWYREGRQCRDDDKPSIIWLHLHYMEEIWIRDGKLFREDIRKPVILYTAKSGATAEYPNAEETRSWETLQFCWILRWSDGSSRRVDTPWWVWAKDWAMEESTNDPAFRGFVSWF